jgi:hypothetical protein
MARIPQTVKLLTDLSESDFICSVAQAILLRSQNMPAAYREQLTATIRAEIARLIEQGYPLDNPEVARLGFRVSPGEVHHLSPRPITPPAPRVSRRTRSTLRAPHS